MSTTSNPAQGVETPRTDRMMRPWVYDAEGKPYQAPFVMEHKAAELERELYEATAQLAAERAIKAELVAALESCEVDTCALIESQVIPAGIRAALRQSLNDIRTALARAKEVQPHE